MQQLSNPTNTHRQQAHREGRARRGAGLGQPQGRMRHLLQHLPGGDQGGVQQALRERATPGFHADVGG